MDGHIPRPTAAQGAVVPHAPAAPLTPPEATFRAMAEAMPQLVWSTTPDGYHDYFNERWYAFTGMPRPGEPGGEGDVAQGWHWKDYLHPDDYEPTVAAWARCLDTGAPYEVEYRLKEAATGAYRWFLSRAVALRDAAGAVTRWFGTCTDVDDVKRTEASLALLARAGSALGATLEVEEALAAVAQMAVPEFADWCAVDLSADGTGASGVARRVAVAHVDPAKVALAQTLAERYPTAPDAPVGVPYVLRTGRPELTADIPDALLEQGARDAEHLAALRALGLRSYVVVPMLAAEVGAGASHPAVTAEHPVADGRPRVVGALTFVSAEGGRRYGAAELETATELARRAATALERARLYGAMRRDRARLAEQAEELTVQNEQLQQQAAELEMQSAQLHEQATELEIAHEHLREQAAELEAANAAMRVRTAQLAEQGVAAERARREAERIAAERDAAGRQLAAVLEQSPMGIAVAEAPSGRFVLVNRRTHEIFGRSRLSSGVQDYSADWQGFHAGGPRAGEALAPHEWPLARAVERGEVVSGEDVEVLHRDGHRMLISINAGPVRDDAGAVVAGVAIFHDVSAERRMVAERERLVAALEVERARLADVFRQAPAFIGVVRGPRHVFEMVNDAYYQLIGFRDVVGRPVAEALPEVRDQGFLELLDGVLRTGEPFTGTEMPIVLQRARGGPPEQRYVTFVYQPLTEADGTRSGVFAHGVDVTGQVVARAEVERARADAEVARRRAEEANKAKSEFLAAMSHELRTPLNAIGGYAELMEMGVRGPVSDEQRADLARIRRSQRHLLTLITDILNFARLEGGRVEYDLRPVALADLIADVAPMIEPQLAAQQLAYDVRLAGGGDATARADQEKVRQILINLLSNAAKFTPAGGRVAVEVDAPPGDAVLVRVADTGIGIPADKLDAIFDPFVQVQSGLTRRHEGTGLGLAISRDLARGMGGDLTVESALGEGSTFTLRLPRA
jgi:PAS domain S-box-containing protein